MRSNLPQFCAALLALSLSFARAQSPNAANIPSDADKTVVKVGDDALKARDIEAAGASSAQMARLGDAKLEQVDLGKASWTQSAGASVAAQYVLTLLLAHQARIDRLDNATDYPRQGAGLDRIDWLAVAEYKKVVQANITAGEISRYYSAHAGDFAKVEVQVIAIRTKASLSKAGALGLTPDETRQRVEAIRKALAAGADTAEIARQFAVPNVVGIKTQVFARGELPHEQEQQIFGIANGAITELQEPEGATILIHAVRRIQPPEQEVASNIESRLRQEKFQTLVTRLVNANSIWIDQKYFDAIAAGQRHPSQ